MGLAPDDISDGAKSDGGTSAKSRQSLSLLFANITEWGPKALSWLLSLYNRSGYAAHGNSGIFYPWDIICIAEHRLDLPTMLALHASLAKQGWRVIGAAALPGNKEHSTSGGTMVLVRSHLAVWPVLRAPCCSSPSHPTVGHGFDWTAVEVRLRGSVFVLITIYLTNSVGFSGPNLVKAAQIGSFVKGLRGPIALTGDFDMDPDELVQSGFLDQLGPPGSFSVAPPTNTSSTCSSGLGRVLDFYVYNLQAQALFSAPQAHADCPWKTHKGVSTEVLCTPLSIQVEKRVKPRDPRKVQPQEKDNKVVPVSWSDAASLATSSGCSYNWSKDLRGALDAPLGSIGICAKQTLQLTESFEQFGRTLDQWHVRHLGLSEQHWHAYQGTLAPLKVKSCRLTAKGVNVSNHPLVEEHLHWATIAAQLDHIGVTIKVRQRAGSWPPDPGNYDACSLGPTMTAWLWNRVDQEQDEHEKPMLLTLTLQLAGGPFLALDQCTLAIAAVQKRVDAVQCRVRHYHAGRSKAWAANAVQGSAAEAFAAVKASPGGDPGIELPAVPGQKHSRPQLTYHPQVAMAARSQRWSSQWSSEVDINKVTGLLHSLHAEAKEDVMHLSPLEVPQLGKHCKAIKWSTSLGGDGLTPKTILLLPDEGKAQLVQLFNSCVSLLQLPVQGLLNLLSVIPKPVQGERLVARMPMVLRILFRMRRWEIGSWEDAKHGFWDNAIAGSSALQAAIKRSFLVEVATTLGASAAMAFIDIEKI